MRHKPNLINCPIKEWKIPLGEGNARLHTTAFLAQRKRDPIPQFEGTGVVMCAGGLLYLREAFISLSRLRSTGCELPVQVWHLGPRELPDDIRRRFDHLRVQFVDAHEVRKIHPARQLYGWELKSFALQWSAFQHVMLLDADCAPLRNPSSLFDSEHYQDYGAIMWPDIQHCRRDDKAFGFLGVRKPEGYMEVESGQMMIDKHRTWRALELCRWMNDFSEFWYRYFHGDKSTFDLAFLRTDTPYLLAPPCTWEGWGLSQRWMDGQPIFQHRMQVKRGFQGLAEDQVYAGQFDRLASAA